MANLLTKEVTFVPEDGWVLVGIAERRDRWLDLFNESDYPLRLYSGQEIEYDASVASIPILARQNYYIEGDYTSLIYVKSEAPDGTQIKVSYTEG